MQEAPRNSDDNPGPLGDVEKAPIAWSHADSMKLDFLKTGLIQDPQYLKLIDAFEASGLKVC